MVDAFVVAHEVLQQMADHLIAGEITATPQEEQLLQGIG